MIGRTRSLLLAGAAAAALTPAWAADVTPDRLVNADKEPHNWLMNHRTYDAQRYSPLDKINKGNIKGLKLAYAVAIGGTAANENLQATPLAEDGYLYIVDQWGVVYKIDVRSGDTGRIVWRMDPGQEKLPLSQPRRRALGQFRHLHRQLSGARHRHRQGHRQGGVGDQSARPAGRADHRGAAVGEGQDPRRRRRRRPRRARLDRRHSTPPPARRSGRNTWSRRRASPAARPGRTRTRSPSRSAAAPCGSRARTIPPATR